MRKGHLDHHPTSKVMLNLALQMVKPARQQLEGDNKSYNSTIHYLPCIFDAVQQQQQVKRCVPHTGLDSKCYKQESTIWKCGEIICNLQTYAHTQITLNGHPSPISLDKYHTLVLPLDSYDSESDRPPQLGYNPVGMNDEDWAEDNMDMRDYPAHADEPSTVSDKHIERASSIVKVPTIATHLPDPTHLSTPEESPRTGDDKDADKPISEEGAATDNLEVDEEVPMLSLRKSISSNRRKKNSTMRTMPPLRSVNKLSRSVNKLLRRVNKLSRLTRTKKPLLWRLKNQPSGNGWEILSMNEPALILTQVRPQASWSPYRGSRVPKVDISPVKGVVTFVAKAVIVSTPY